MAIMSRHPEIMYESAPLEGVVHPLHRWLDQMVALDLALRTYDTTVTGSVRSEFHMPEGTSVGVHPSGPEKQLQGLVISGGAAYEETGKFYTFDEGFVGAKLLRAFSVEAEEESKLRGIKVEALGPRREADDTESPGSGLGVAIPGSSLRRGVLWTIAGTPAWLTKHIEEVRREQASYHLAD